ncbi:putative amine oxidase [copper-containing] [Patella vulgata]|uniref:putative amine oxidase [copper-containing] n=1 Tax=Patella vulgata TaxID=6465 RepID=UPI0021804F41|nr:putative amine oxidase [copper-containing] [Patella vulgata]
MKKLSVVTLILALSILANIALVVVVFWLTHTETCDHQHQTPEELSNCTDYVNVFEDLRAEEINEVLEYLYSQKSLQLVKPNKANLTTNYILGIELHVPNKSLALDFLDSGGEKPVREAKAILFLPQRDPPVVEEYIISPIPKPSNHYLNPRRNKSIPYRVRQFSNTEMVAAVRLLQKEVATKVENMLKRSYGAAFTNCDDKCLTFTASAISSAFSKKRKLWITSLYQQEFSTLHPVGFQILINMDGTNASEWKIEKLWYANKMFDSVDELVHKYENNEIPKLVLRFPEPEKGESTIRGSLHIRGKQFPNIPKSGPRQYEPQGHRYTVHNQHVNYINWEFNYRMSYTSGIQLYDIRFQGERIIYELSMQEIAIVYAGASPNGIYAQLSDSAFGFGNRAYGMMPGVDCPEHATFLGSTILNEDFLEAKNYPNSICIFEHNTALPLRRHKSNSVRSGFFYAGVVDYVLIVRTAFVMFNYDYIIDFVFHQNGAIDVKIHATGFIMSSLYFSEEEAYGMKMSDSSVGSVHQHLFSFKADIDILGTKNRYVTLDTEIDNKTRKWFENGEYFSQLTFKRKLKRTELEAAYKFNFDTPKYHIVLNNDKLNPYSEPRGYRVITKGFSKQMLPQNVGFEKSMSWSRYQMAMTKRKEDESTTSSMHSMFDGGDPVVNFQKYLNDDENIVDEDLVTWISLGMHHIPHTEDLPNTATTGNEMSITFLPYNYFPEDPSVGSRDAIRVDAKSENKGRVTFQRHGTPFKFTCPPQQPDFEQILKNGSVLFMSLAP